MSGEAGAEETTKQRPVAGRKCFGAEGTVKVKVKGDDVWP